MKKDIPCKCKPKEVGVAILISDIIHFKTKTVIRDKEGSLSLITHGTFSNLDHMLLSQKMSLNKCKVLKSNQGSFPTAMV